MTAEQMRRAVMTAWIRVPMVRTLGDFLEQMELHIKAAVEEEREACARIADSFPLGEETTAPTVILGITNRIRSRGKS